MEKTKLEKDIEAQYDPLQDFIIEVLERNILPKTKESVDLIIGIMKVFLHQNIDPTVDQIIDMLNGKIE